MNNILFTSKTCKACPKMKANLDESGIPYEVVDVNTKVGRFLSAQYRVMTLPMFIHFVDDKPTSYPGVRPMYELVALKRSCHQGAGNAGK
jgi:glutaredoxin-related protein